jgi:hypothetical protein
METPIYENLRDFKENYLIDYAEQTNTKFIKYLNQLHRNYKIIEHIFQINNSILFMINYSYNELNYKFKKYESTKLAIYENAINEIKSGINDNVKTLEKNIKDYHLNEFYNEAINIIKKYPSEYNYDELELIIKTLDEIRDNFTDIIEFIDEKIQDEKINLLRYSNNTNTNPTQKIENEIPEYDFSDNEDKVKLIILEKLGVIEYIKSIQQKPATISHTAEILSTFTGIKSGSLYTYLRPMICNVRDDKDKNSPYNNAENLPKANRQILKLKIIDANK